jgi:hypothetical protein
MVVKVMVICLLVNSLCFHCCASEKDSSEKHRQTGAFIAREAREELQFNVDRRNSGSPAKESLHKRDDSHHKRVGSMSPSSVEELGLDNQTIKACLANLATQPSPNQQLTERVDFRPDDPDADRQSREYLEDLASKVPVDTTRE